MPTYSAQTTAEEIAQDLLPHIANKTILVTGASPTGLGAVFASTVAKYQPQALILANRDIAKAEETATEIAKIAPSVRTVSVALDLSSLAQVREAAEKINSLDENIDIIVNNAGVMAVPYSKTVDGFERQFATNYLGHFLLTNLLLPKILARNVPVRVVNVSSNGYRWSPIRFEDLDFDNGEVYNRWMAYSQSKTACNLFSVSLAKKLGSKGVVSASLHPGIILTRLSRDLAYEDFGELPELDRTHGLKTFMNTPPVYKSPSQGVATHFFAAFHPSLDSPELNGSYLSDCNPEEARCFARDPIDAEHLWKLSEELVGQKFTY